MSVVRTKCLFFDQVELLLTRLARPASSAALEITYGFPAVPLPEKLVSTLSFHVEVAAEAVSGAISTNGTKPTTISTESANARTFLQVLFTNTILSSFRKSHTRMCYHNTLTVSIFYFILHFFVQNTQPIRQ